MKPSTTASSSTDQGPLGVIDEAEYQRLETRLDHGDMVLGYGNLLTECRDADGKTMGVSGLLELVRKTDPDRPKEFLEALISRIRRSHRTNKLDNEATLVLCRATDRAVAWRENILAPFRWLGGGVSDNTRLG